MDRERDERREWMARVERLLGPAHGEEEPSSAELVEHLEGSARAAEAAELLLSNPAIARAARAGLQEAERLEESLSRLERSGRPVPDLELGGPYHGVIPVAPGPALRAAAADCAEDVAPIPEDRLLLADHPDLFRLIYYRHGARAFVTLLLERPEQLELAGCSLDDAPLAAAEDGIGRTFALGPIGLLPGRRLSLHLRRAGEDRRFSWTLVEI